MRKNKRRNNFQAFFSFCYVIIICTLLFSCKTKTKTPLPLDINNLPPGHTIIKILNKLPSGWYPNYKDSTTCFYVTPDDSTTIKIIGPPGTVFDRRKSVFYFPKKLKWWQ